MHDATRRGATPGSKEFIALVATCMGMSAVSIDLLLPAFSDMRADFGLAAGATEVSRIITAYFLGLAVGQLFFGPLSDRYGRKKMLYVGMAIFIAGAFASVLQSTLTGLVVCRFVWGIGAASPRSLAIAMVRDTFDGDRMARTMSLVMTIFILVPVFAPAIGAGILEVAPWRAVLWVQIAIAAGLTLWLTRLPETLHEEDRRGASFGALGGAARAVFRSRETLVFGFAITAIFGIMTSYVGTSEVVIDEVFGEADRFPLIFGVLAGTLALGSMLSARVVVRIGLDRLVRLGAVYLLLMAGGLGALAWATDGSPPLWAFCLAMALLLPGVSVLIPSCNTAAMEPLGHVAGMGAAVLGTMSTAGGAILGILTDQAFDGTISPFAFHVLVYAAVGAGAILLLARRPQPGPVVLDTTEVALA